MTDNKVPRFLKNRLDLRFYTVNCFSEAIEYIKAGKIENVSMSQDTKTIIITNFGIITGDILNYGEEEDGDILKAIIDGTVGSRNRSLSEIEEENTENLRPINDSSFIIVKNAKIRPYANFTNNFKIAEMMLFTDQIVGLSAGSPTLEK